MLRPRLRSGDLEADLDEAARRGLLLLEADLDSAGRDLLLLEVDLDNTERGLLLLEADLDKPGRDLLLLRSFGGFDILLDDLELRIEVSNTVRRSVCEAEGAGLAT